MKLLLFLLLLFITGCTEETKAIIDHGGKIVDPAPTIILRIPSPVAIGIGKYEYDIGEGFKTLYEDSKTIQNEIYITFSPNILRL